MAARKKKAAEHEHDPFSPPVVYVHGIGEQPPEAELKQIWDLALFGREMDRTTMAHWSEILHPRRTGAAKKRVVAAADDREPGAEELLAEAGVDPSNRKAMQLVRGLQRFAGSDQVATVRGKAIPAPAFIRRPIARAFLNTFIRDTAAYFFGPGLRRKIQDKLRKAILPARGGELTVVAHSQGSVIALEVLADVADEYDTIHLITLGSPLGIQEVQDFLECKLCVPSRVSSWHNFADPFDPVALDKGLGDDYTPPGIIVDELILNTRTRRLQGFNPHSAAGYLSHPKVRVATYRACMHDLNAKFLVARDVAGDLAVEDAQPVLIEILEAGYRAIDETQQELEKREEVTEGGRTDFTSRVDRAATRIEAIVQKSRGRNANARVERLRRFVGAHLTPNELTQVARQHKDLRVYAVWKSGTKRKLVDRSCRVIQADAARTSYVAMGNGIRWAVLDTGARRDHPHFAKHGTIEEVWDCTRSGPPTRINAVDDQDDDGHGTHVAGIVAGEWTGADGRCMQGMAPMAKLVVYKVLDKGVGEDAWIIKALDHIAARNENNSEIYYHGVNLSLGGPFDATVYGCGFTPLCQELRRLWQNGVIVCVASGNEGQVEVSTPEGELDLNSPMSIGDPANLESSIAVGSVNADKPHLYGVSWFSSRGPTADGRAKPDVVAPGERILSCSHRFRKEQPGSFYRHDSGTSMAAPHVSGMLAAFLSVRPEFRGRPDEVKALMLRTCIDLRRDRYHQGHGVPNLMRMLLEA